MFGFFDMLDNYEERKVDRFEKDDLIISTANVTDSSKPYETAVAHPSYKNGNFLVVELYDTIEKAKEGHNQWVDKMTSDELPESLKDVGTCDVVKFASDLGIDLNKTYTRS